MHRALPSSWAGGSAGSEAAEGALPARKADATTDAAPATESSGDPMEIHKPHPIHGWRGFLKELGTIVLGILIALSLEQMVEAGREARESREAREDVRSEIGVDLAVLDWRRAEQGCIDRRLQEIETLLEAAAAGKPTPPVRWIGRPTSGPMFTFRFEAAMQAGRTSLFSSDEQAGYAAVYFPLSRTDQTSQSEQVSWAHLQGLVGAGRLTPEMILNLRQALAEAKFENYQIKLTAMRAREDAGRLRLVATPRQPNRARRFTCAPMTRPPPADGYEPDAHPEGDRL